MNYQEFIKNQQKLKTKLSDYKCGFEIDTGREGEYINVEADFDRGHIALQRGCLTADTRDFFSETCNARSLQFTY